jgi:hypothetical protein
MCIETFDPFKLRPEVRNPFWYAYEIVELDVFELVTFIYWNCGALVVSFAIQN